MNNGKICVSVCAETANELIEKIKIAETLADVVEIRFDCLNESEFDLALKNIGKESWTKPFLATFRPKNQLAMFSCPLSKDTSAEIVERKQQAVEYRENGWNKIAKIKAVELVDFETDIHHEFLMTKFIPTKNAEYFFSKETDELLKEKEVIISEHFFEDIPQNLREIYDGMKSEAEDGLNVEIVKIAVQTQDITDTIPIWNLLKQAKSENQEIIPIAMGESGKWTRILGLAHGAFMTYASLDSSSETAPGQVSAQDLREVYRARELNEKTEVYGILGSNTSVSMSPYIHNEAFKFHNLNSVFVPLQVHNLDEFMRRMVKPETREVELNFKGFAVTLPHKQNIIKHLDFLDASANAIGAVNTVKIQDGKLYGYNTDAHGFIQPLLQTYGDLKDAKVAVLGAGGAARACVYALKKHGAKVTIFARDLNKTKSLAEEFGVELKPLTTHHSPLTIYSDFDILVNTTPLGMKGKAETETPAIAEQLKGLHLIYDLIYVPFQTTLMAEADKAEIPKIGGLAMLIAQAIEQQRIWTGLEAPMKEMSRAALKRLT